MTEPPGRPVLADLTDPDALRTALEDVRPTHVFRTAWARQDTEQRNIEVDAGIVRDVPDTPFHEDEPRLP